MAKVFSQLNIVKLLSIAFVIRLVFLFTSAYHPDLLNHLDWGIRFWSYGPKNFYEGIFWGVSWPNQPFLSMVLFALISKLRDVIFSLFWFINQNVSIFPSSLITILEHNLHIWLVKTPFIIADLGIGYLIYRLLKPSFPTKALIGSSLFLLNPVIIYNSTIWGQTDSLINLLALTGIYLIFKNRHWLGIPIFLTSFLFKLSLIIYAPVVFLIIIKQKKLFKSSLISLIFFIFILLLVSPFSGDKTSIDWFLYMYQNRVLPRQGNMLNGNAFNFWLALFGLNFDLKENLRLSLLSAKSIGLILFSVGSTLSALPLLQKLNLSNILNTLFLTAFSAFMFMTNMHERYLYPIIPIFNLLIFYKPKIFTIKLLVLVSFIHLLNLYNLWYYPLIPLLKNILEFNSFLLPRFLSVLLLAIYLYYLVKYFIGEKTKS